MTCQICEAEFEPKFDVRVKDVTRNLCDECCAELAYLFVTGHTMEEVDEDRKLVN